MRLDRAIENLKAGREDAGMIPGDEYTPTLDLATEAMKRIRHDREAMRARLILLLPGETEE